MTIRNNEATLNRPAGDRILDAPYVFFNITSSLEMIKKENAWLKGDRNGLTVFKSESLTITVTALKKDALVDKVQAEGFMTLQLIEGHIIVTTPDGDMEMLAGHVMVFHPSIQYTIKAKRESSFLLSHYNSFFNSSAVL